MSINESVVKVATSDDVSPHVQSWCLLKTDGCLSIIAVNGRNHLFAEPQRRHIRLSALQFGSVFRLKH